MLFATYPIFWSNFAAVNFRQKPGTAIGSSSAVCSAEIKNPQAHEPAGTCFFLAERMGLEPTASGVTGRRYNRLNYRSVFLPYIRFTRRCQASAKIRRRKTRHPPALSAVENARESACGSLLAARPSDRVQSGRASPNLPPPCPAPRSRR